MAVHQAVGAFELLHRPGARRRPDGAALRGADAPECSKGHRHRLAQRRARRQARRRSRRPASTGIELFDNDLVASPLSPREVAARCADLGLSDRPLPAGARRRGRAARALRRRAAPVPRQARRDGRARRDHRARAAPTSAADAVDDLDLSAEQLHALGDLAAEQGVTDRLRGARLGSARQPGRPGLGRRTARRPPGRHARGRHLPPAVARRRRLRAGRRARRPDRLPAGRRRAAARHGRARVEPALPLLPRRGHPRRRRRRRRDPRRRATPGRSRSRSSATWSARPTRAVTARDAMRSLVFLEDQLGARPTAATGAGRGRPGVPGGPRLRPPYLALLDGARLRARRPAPHQAGRPGGATATPTSSSTTAPPPTRRSASSRPGGSGVAERAKALLWPAVDRTRGAGEAHAARASPHRPGCTSSSAHRPGEERRLAGRLRPLGAAPTAGGWLGIDHVVGRRTRDRASTRRSSFLRTLLRAGGRHRRGVHGAARPAAQPGLPPGVGRLRVVLNVEESARSAGGRHHPGGLRLRRRAGRGARRCARAGVPLMPVPDNYYVDLDARFGLGARAARRPARARPALRPGRRRRAAARVHRAAAPPASTSSCSSGAAGTTATARPDHAAGDAAVG